MTRLAKPGGWVASMEPDLPGMLCHPPHPGWERLVEISAATYRSDGADLRVGRRVPGLLREAGLTDVAAEARADFYPPGHSRRTVRLADPATLVIPHLFVLTRGRKPAR